MTAKRPFPPRPGPSLLMTIEFACPECTHPVKTPDSQQGKRGRCPNCQAIFTIPENTVSDSAVTERTIRFECQQCNKKLKVPVSRADKKITCPQCGAVVTNEEIKSSGSLSGILTTDGKIEFPCGELDTTCGGCCRSGAVHGRSK